MKTGKRLVGAGFELGEGLGILRRRRSLERRCRQRFVSAKRLAAPAQHQVADRPSPKLFGSIGDRGADANTGAEKLVGRLEPCCGVNGVTIGRVIEKTTAAEIA